MSNSFFKRLSLAAALAFVTLTGASAGPDIEIMPVAWDGLRLDARAALVSMISAGKGVSVESDYGIDLSPELAQTMRAEGMAYDNFTPSITVTNYRAPIAADPYGHGLRGVITYRDVWQRRAATLYELRYRAVPERLLIDTVEFSPFYPKQPRVKAMVVPTEKLATDRAELSKSWESLMAFAIKNSLAPAELAKQKEGSYFVLTFFLDRLPEDAVIEMRLAAAAKNMGAVVKSTQFNFDGWRVTIFRSDYDPRGKPQYAQAIMRMPTSDMPGGPVHEILAGAFPLASGRAR